MAQFLHNYKYRVVYIRDLGGLIIIVLLLYIITKRIIRIYILIIFQNPLHADFHGP